MQRVGKHQRLILAMSPQKSMRIGGAPLNVSKKVAENEKKWADGVDVPLPPAPNPPLNKERKIEQTKLIILKSVAILIKTRVVYKYLIDYR